MHFYTIYLYVYFWASSPKHSLILVHPRCDVMKSSLPSPACFPSLSPSSSLGKNKSCKSTEREDILRKKGFISSPPSLYIYEVVGGEYRANHRASSFSFWLLHPLSRVPLHWRKTKHSLLLILYVCKAHSAYANPYKQKSLLLGYTAKQCRYTVAADFAAILRPGLASYMQNCLAKKVTKLPTTSKMTVFCRIAFRFVLSLFLSRCGRALFSVMHRERERERQ